MRNFLVIATLILSLIAGICLAKEYTISGKIYGDGNVILRVYNESGIVNETLVENNYTIKLEEGTYRIMAFKDLNGNNNHDPDEPYGYAINKSRYNADEINLTENLTNVDITLSKRYPDIVVWNVTSPYFVARGENITVNFSIKNSGNESVEQFEITIFISYNPQYVNREIKNIIIEEFLPNQTINFSEKIRIPTDIPVGKYCIVVWADYDSVVYEENKDNNMNYSEIWAGPYIIIRNVTFIDGFGKELEEGDYIFPYENIYTECEIENLGKEGIENLELRKFLSEDENPSVSEDAEFDAEIISINAKERKNISFNFYIPPCYMPYGQSQEPQLKYIKDNTSYYFIILPYKYYSSIWGKKNVSGPFIVRKPELLMENITYEKNVTLWTAFNFSITIRNKAKNCTVFPEPCTSCYRQPIIKIFISKDPAGHQIKEVGMREIPAPFNKSIRINVSVNLLPEHFIDTHEGVYYLYLMLLYNGDKYYGNISYNNTLFKKIYLHLPDVAIDFANVSKIENILPGETLDVWVRIRNAGKVVVKKEFMEWSSIDAYISKDGVFDTYDMQVYKGYKDIYIGSTAYYGDIGVNESVNLTFEINIPYTTLKIDNPSQVLENGSYYIIFLFHPFYYEWENLSNNIFVLPIYVGGEMPYSVKENYTINNVTLRKFTINFDSLVYTLSCGGEINITFPSFNGVLVEYSPFNGTGIFEGETEISIENEKYNVICKGILNIKEDRWKTGENITRHWRIDLSGYFEGNGVNGIIEGFGDKYEENSHLYCAFVFRKGPYGPFKISLHGELKFENDTQQSNVEIIDSSNEAHITGKYLTETGVGRVFYTCIEIKSGEFAGKGYMTMNYVAQGMAGNGYAYCERENDLIHFYGIIGYNTGYLLSRFYNASTFTDLTWFIMVTGTIHPQIKQIDMNIEPLHIDVPEIPLNVKIMASQYERGLSGDIINYVVECENYGEETINASVIIFLDPRERLISSPDLYYNNYTHTLSWDVSLKKGERKFAKFTAQLLWGLPCQKQTYDYSIKVWGYAVPNDAWNTAYNGLLFNDYGYDKNDVAFNKIYERISYMDKVRWIKVLNETNFLTGLLESYLAWKGVATPRNGLNLNISGSYGKIEAIGASAPAIVNKIKNGQLNTTELYLVCPLWINQSDLEELRGKAGKVIVYQGAILYDWRNAFINVIERSRVIGNTTIKIINPLGFGERPGEWQPSMQTLHQPSDEYLKELINKIEQVEGKELDKIEIYVGNYPGLKIGNGKIVFIWEDGNTDEYYMESFIENDFISIINVDMFQREIPPLILLLKEVKKELEGLNPEEDEIKLPMDVIEYSCPFPIGEYINEKRLRYTVHTYLMPPPIDPNAKYGPDEAMPGQRIEYEIEFENIGNGTAYGVYVVDYLDDMLNVSSLKIGPTILNNTTIGYTGFYDENQNAIIWHVGRVLPHEKGMMNFSIKIKDDAPYGAEIINYATVYFANVPDSLDTTFVITKIVAENNTPPVPPFSPFPQNNSKNVGINISLSWECYDIDNDTITYDIYFGTIPDPPKVASNYSLQTYKPDLQYGKKYYWRIVAWDGKGGKSVSELWNFETVSVYTLNISVVPENAGFVDIEPEKEFYEENEKVTLTAIPNSGYKFAYWSGDASGNSATIQITMDSNKTIIAHFEPIQETIQYTLTTNVEPSNAGNIVLNPSGGIYDAGTVVTLTAIPNSGYKFAYWSGDASGNSATIQITMDSNKTIIAYFTKQSQHTSTQNPPPTVHIVYPVNGSTINGTITIEGTASNDAIKVEIGINGEWFVANGITSWKYIWNTRGIENGEYIIKARSYDGYQYSEIDSIKVNVFNNIRPFIYIIQPVNGSVVKGKIIVRGVAWDKDGNESIQKVEIKIDDKDWMLADGKNSWSYELDTTKIGNGKHLIMVRAYDGIDYNVSSLILYVKNENIESYTWAIVVGILIIIAVTMVIMRKRSMR